METRKPLIQRPKYLRYSLKLDCMAKNEFLSTRAPLIYLASQISIFDNYIDMFNLIPFLSEFVLVRKRSETPRIIITITSLGAKKLNPY